jgi:hypothetical protein
VWLFLAILLGIADKYIYTLMMDTNLESTLALNSKLGRHDCDWREIWRRCVELRPAVEVLDEILGRLEWERLGCGMRKIRFSGYELYQARVRA